MNKSQFGKSHISFHSKKPVTSTVELRKLENLNHFTPFVFKLFRTMSAIESLVLFLQSIKQCFKHSFANLLLIDRDLQNDFFALSKVRPTIFKRQAFGKGTLIAVFDKEEDIKWPKIQSKR